MIMRTLISYCSILINYYATHAPVHYVLIINAISKHLRAPNNDLNPLLVISSALWRPGFDQLLRTNVLQWEFS